MGLIRAVMHSVSGTLKDQWKEFFYCEALPSNVLVTKGYKQISRKFSSTKSSDNIISNGSGIVVADGQCMMIVDNGRVIEICAEPGEYTYDSSTEPSIFSGSLGTSVVETFKTIARRIEYGGNTGHDQRVYYFNIKELLGNKFGTPTPVPFRVVDKNIGLDMDITIRCNGEYTYRIIDPILFYTNVCGNVNHQYTSDQIAGTLKSEFLSALQPAFAQISEMGIRYSALPGHTQELCNAMNQTLSQKWKETRGLEIISVSVNSVTAPKEDEELIKQAQRTGMLQNLGMTAATLAQAQADAMKAAADNTGSAMVGFMNMNMAQQSGGIRAQQLYQMQANQQSYVNTWICVCGAKNTNKFCMECGKPKPSTETVPPVNIWRCRCGAQNTGKFCTECGQQKTVAKKQYRCDKCGWIPENPAKPPKFCPECGDIFNADDAF